MKEKHSVFKLYMVFDLLINTTLFLGYISAHGVSLVTCVFADTRSMRIPKIYHFGSLSSVPEGTNQRVLPALSIHDIGWHWKGMCTVQLTLLDHVAEKLAVTPHNPHDRPCTSAFCLLLTQARVKAKVLSLSWSTSTLVAHTVKQTLDKPWLKCTRLNLQ